MSGSHGLDLAGDLPHLHAVVPLGRVGVEAEHAQADVGALRDAGGLGPGPAAGLGGTSTSGSSGPVGRTVSCASGACVLPSDGTDGRPGSARDGEDGESAPSSGSPGANTKTRPVTTRTARSAACQGRNRNFGVELHGSAGLGRTLEAQRGLQGFREPAGVLRRHVLGVAHGDVVADHRGADAVRTEPLQRVDCPHARRARGLERRLGPPPLPAGRARTRRLPRSGGRGAEADTRLPGQLGSVADDVDLAGLVAEVLEERLPARPGAPPGSARSCRWSRAGSRRSPGRRSLPAEVDTTTRSGVISEIVSSAQSLNSSQPSQARPVARSIWTALLAVQPLKTRT